VKIVLEDGDTPDIALEKARTICDESLAAGRDASIRDWLTDLMGGATGAAGYGIITTLNAESAETAERLNRP
jgi:hypothetical protein